ncbi:glycosyltransferase family 2 protein [Autumnicola musiva]|uniref:Glycosyltransferase family 2 protein n=1 Tax=Autumnicola musiva TaxID=3075589 RepID=A0ABU3D7D4_9FLAO|nr:glycosyltransferase family 2 protein [Zunongwangia sp. F117]MDT0677446.1 glycosyltransferase family 2 protein [Zunongwangia sp. F117]
MEQQRVGVVILTCNRLNLLKISLCKVLAQSHKPYEILIVDNFSTDGTKEYLDSLEDQNISKMYLDENTGPAGGFYEGVKYFAEKTSVDYLWLMDDDFFPFDSCLEILVSAVDQETMVFPFIREKDFASRREPGWWGVLIPMNIVNKVGYPRKELFFWSEDTEYLLFRIRRKYKYKAKWISSAKGVHFTKRETNYRKPWRYYYEVRNMLYMRLYVRERSIRRYFKMVKSWVKLFGAIVIKENDKGKKIRFFLRGTIDGISKKLGKTVDPYQDFSSSVNSKLQR